MSTRLFSLTRFAALLFLGLVAGATFAIWQGFDPRALPPGAFILIHQNAVRGLNVLLPVIGLLGIISIALCAVLARKNRTAVLLFLGAFLCTIAAGVITRSINQPINAEVLTWTPTTFPSNWQLLRDTWWSWHVARTILSTIGFALLVATTIVA